MNTGAARFAVVGGGISGLAAAHRLAELCHGRGEPPSLIVLEASDRFGGVIRTERSGERLIEAGADSFLTTKPGGVELCERLGLGGDLVRTDPGANGTRILIGGRLHEIPAGFLMMAPTRLGPLLRSRLFSPAAKLRMLLERFVPAARGDGDESLATFVRRRFGREVLERVAEPVLASVFMADAEKLSVSAVLPRFVEMERRFGSVTGGLRRALGGVPGRPHGGGAFAYVGSGSGAIVDGLVARLPEGAGRLRAPLLAVAREPDGRWRLRTGAGELLADSVILASPAHALADALAPVDDALAGELARQEYASCATVSLAYRAQDIRRPLEGFGFFVPRGEGLDVLAASFSSLKFRGRSPAGEVLIRCFLGGALRPALAELSEEALARLAHEQLRRILDVQGEPRFAWTVRFPRSMPQYEVGFPRRAQSIAARLGAYPGLYLAGSALGAVGLPDCIRSGERAAESAFSAGLADARAVGGRRAG